MDWTRWPALRIRDHQVRQPTEIFNTWQAVEHCGKPQALERPAPDTSRTVFQLVIAPSRAKAERQAFLELQDQLGLDGAGRPRCRLVIPT